MNKKKIKEKKLKVMGYDLINIKSPLPLQFDPFSTSSTPAHTMRAVPLRPPSPPHSKIERVVYAFPKKKLPLFQAPWFFFFFGGGGPSTTSN